MKNISQVLKAGLLVGTLDILAACIQFFINTHKGPSPVFKFIASGVFGAEAFSGGITMIIAGLIFHYIIAMGFTFLFFAIYPSLRSITQKNMVIGIVYGVFVWCAMKFVVVPLSLTPPQPFSYAGAAAAIIILIICVGIPLSVIAAKNYQQDKASELN